MSAGKLLFKLPLEKAFLRGIWIFVFLSGGVRSVTFDNLQHFWAFQTWKIKIFSDHGGWSPRLLFYLGSLIISLMFSNLTKFYEKGVLGRRGSHFWKCPRRNHFEEELKSFIWPARCTDPEWHNDDGSKNFVLWNVKKATFLITWFFLYWQ